MAQAPKGLKPGSVRVVSSLGWGKGWNLRLHQLLQAGWVGVCCLFVSERILLIVVYEGGTVNLAGDAW
jgi:hypothetical protein